MRLEPRGLVISLREAAFFPSGEDTIEPASYAQHREDRQAMRKACPNPVRLEGHTDSVPIHTARFRNNWELSAARSIAMLDVLSAKFADSRRSGSPSPDTPTRSPVGSKRHR